jgi:hypothetical protein
MVWNGILILLLIKNIKKENGMLKSNAFKWFLVVSLLLFASDFSFAYDGEVTGGYDGNLTRYAFIQQASDLNLARTVLQNAFDEGAIIDRLFAMGEDDVDGEDVAMLNDLEAYISTEYELENGGAYSYSVKRGESANNEFDGWLVFSHYLDSSGWYHYIYYFLIK